MIFIPRTLCLPDGMTPVADASNSPMRRQKFSLLKLAAAEKMEFRRETEEMVLVLLAGQGRGWAGDQDLGETGHRKDVFNSPAWTYYIPPRTSFSLEAVQDSEWAVIEARTNQAGSPALIPPEKVTMKTVGQVTYQREVHTIIGSGFLAGAVIVGETFNQPGCWSSYPPHRHEEHRPPHEHALEEVYHYRVDPAQGFGVQCYYTDDRRNEEAYLVKNRDTFVIPDGYHPVVAAPGYRLYYFWSLAGEIRLLLPHEDPAHRWVGENV